MLNLVGGGGSFGGGLDIEGDFNRKFWRLYCNVRIIKDGQLSIGKFVRKLFCII